MSKPVYGQTIVALWFSRYTFIWYMYDLYIYDYVCIRLIQFWIPSSVKLDVLPSQLHLLLQLLRGRSQHAVSAVPWAPLPLSHVGHQIFVDLAQFCSMEARWNLIFDFFHVQSIPPVCANKIGFRSRRQQSDSITLISKCQGTLLPTPHHPTKNRANIGGCSPLANTCYTKI